MSKSYDPSAIADLLPHRAPLLLAEHLEISESDSSGVGSMRLPSEPLWEGEATADFYPELLLEGSAQLGGLLAHALSVEGEKTEPKHFLVGFPEVHWDDLEKLNPENPVQVRLQLKARMGGMSRLVFSCRQEEIRFCEGEVTLV